jgi:LPS-assembly protein
MQNKFFYIFFFGLFFFQINISFSQQKDTYNFFADKITYLQDNNIIEAIGNVVAKNQEGQIISADRVLYNKTTQILKTFGNSRYSDNKNQNLFAENFNYNLNNKIISAENNVIFEDNLNNIYYFNKITSDDKFVEILGYDLKANLSKKKFETKDKFNEFIEPTLTGKEASIKDKITIIKDGKFTSCKSTNEKEGCPFWNLNSSLIIHDKEKKEITYKNAYLDLNKVPVLFTPYFSHPDPTVKRKAGFLAPDFSSLSKEMGSTVKIPYFYPISESADFTISPVYYFKQHPLLLGEYREKFKNGDLSLEGGITQGYKNITTTQTDGSRSHLYGNLNLELKDIFLDQSQLNAKFQRVNNPTYLQVNKINSTIDNFKKNLVKESDKNLINEVYLNSYGFNEIFNLKAAAYQNISISKSSDQYSYLLPEISYAKYKLYDNKFNFLSNYKHQNSNTNQNKSILVNKLAHTPQENYNANLGIEYKFLSEISNYNYYSDYKTPNENLNSQIDPVVGFNTSMPFAKISKETEQFLVPRVLTRYSPGKMINARTNDITLNTDNLFSLNRMNSDELIEKNLALNVGLDWVWKEKNQKPKEAALSIGQVIKFNKDEDMPIKSSLQNKYSDLVTKVGYFDPKNYSITLKSTLDNSLDHLYYNDLTLKYFTKKSEFNLNFYEKNNHIGNERFAKGNFKTNITDNTLLTIETARNFKTDFTNFNKLAIENENECIRYGLYLQRNYSINNDLKPSTSIFFGITLLPFAENYTSGNLVPSIGGRSLF